MKNTDQQTQSQPITDSQGDAASTSSPDYIAVQYRQVRVGDDRKTRKERVGVAYHNANGSICFRPSGVQIFENDIYLFPSGSVLRQ